MEIRQSPAPVTASLYPQPDRHISGTDLHYDASDLSSSGKLSLMIQARDQRGLERLQRQLKSADSANVTGQLGIVRGLVVEVSEDQASAFIKTLPKGLRVAIDSTIHYPGEVNITDASGGGDNSIFTSQPPPGRDPAGLSTTPTTAPTPLPTGPVDVDRLVINMDKVWAAGYTGKGQTVAVIGSGCYPHPDLKHALKEFKDIADNKPDWYDAYGHDTQTSSLIVGDGTMSGGIVKGTAPDGKLVAVRITTVSEAIQGLEWVIANKDRLGITVVNLSLGDTASQSYQNDLWCQACEKAIKAGLKVVVAAGNEGPDPGSISTPGIDPEVITVGALDDAKQTDPKKFTEGGFSSDGPTTPDKLTKPDVLAPGVRVWGALAPGSKLDAPEIPHWGTNYEALTGSSQATPLVTGLVMCLLEANPHLTQAQIKTILQKSAVPLPGLDANHQGAGVVDGWAALQLALAMKKDNPTDAPPPNTAARLEMAHRIGKWHAAKFTVKAKQP